MGKVCSAIAVVRVGSDRTWTRPFPPCLPDFFFGGLGHDDIQYTYSVSLLRKRGPAHWGVSRELFPIFSSRFEVSAQHDDDDDDDERVEWVWEKILIGWEKPRHTSSLTQSAAAQPLQGCKSGDDTCN